MKESNAIDDAMDEIETDLVLQVRIASAMTRSH